MKRYIKLSICALCLIAYTISYAANNLLANQPSAYLRSHAEDTVQWQLFSTDAFQQARQKQKPILISSGYQACYWCYRMKEDSFKNRVLGSMINESFIPILLDRELEVETDQWLQRFMEQQRGFGGWPLTVILTPDGKPLAGFSYTPAEAFTSTLKRFIQDWQRDPQTIIERATQNQQSLQSGQPQEANNQDGSEQNPIIPIGTLLQSLLQQLGNAADVDYGGFGEREKFPHVPQLNALFELQQLNPDPALQNFMQTTLAAMIGGSLRDHLGGGFFRYSDDRDWGQPHYEKMLYTQALLAPLLIRAGTRWQQPVYVHTGVETLRSMIAAFQREDSYFHSSLSAVNAAGKSGGYYLWTSGQLGEVLSDKERSKVFNLLGEEATLILPFLIAQGTEKQSMRGTLLTARSQRKQSVDDKALTGWNGLALSALATGSQLDARVQQAGTKLAAKLLQLSQQDFIPQLADQHLANNKRSNARTDNTNKTSVKAASLADQVYLAKGLTDWGRQQQKTVYLTAAAQLLLNIYHHYYRPNGWVYSENNPLLGTLIRPHLPDSQLPSTSALWLQTARTLLTTELVAHKTQLATAIAKVETQPNSELTEQAFYHASYIAQQVKQQIIERQTTQQRGVNTQ